MPEKDTPINALRRLAGMTDAQVTTLTGVKTADRDPRRHHQWTQTLKSFGLTAGKASRMEPCPDDNTSLFLFSGDLESFDSEDLSALAWSLDEARQDLVDANSGAGFRARARFQTLLPPPASARDAALQGKALARQVRVVIGNPTGPLSDAVHAAEQLAVTVRTVRFKTHQLRAAAVRDEGQGAASVVVDTRVRDQRLVRVAIAHELCHLLFDPSGSRTSLILDKLPTGHSRERSENRARAFAAEFMAPRGGLVDLLGKPSGQDDPESAKRLVNRTSEHFSVTNELALWHLCNHGFITATVRDILRGELADKTSRGQNGLRALGRPAESASRSRRAKEEARTRSASAERSAGEQASSLLHACVKEATEAPIDVAVALSRYFDEALERGDHALSLALLTQLDTKVMPADASSGFLGYVQVPCRALGGPWREAYGQSAKSLLAAMASVWRWEPEDIADAATALLE